MAFKPFEKRKADKEPKGMKEGSRREEALDRKQAKAPAGRSAGKPLPFAKGGAVKLTGFGTFEKAAVAARTGRNPKTGAPIKIPSTHKPKFTPGATFKDLVKD